MVKKILIGLLVLVGGFAGFVATRPAAFHIERSGTVPAPPEVVYAQIADFHNWKTWSPWEKLDPAMKTTFSGPDSGVGASYAWTGNDKVGEGNQTITAVTPNEKVVIKLEFLKPWKATNTATYTIKPEGDGSKVTWAMDGNQDFMGKAFSVFMDMDKMVGADFEKGLQQLATVAGEAAQKRKAEEAAKAAAAAAPPADAADKGGPEAKPAEEKPADAKPAEGAAKK